MRQDICDLEYLQRVQASIDPCSNEHSPASRQFTYIIAVKLRYPHPSDASYVIMFRKRKESEPGIKSHKAESWQASTGGDRACRCYHQHLRTHMFQRPARRANATPRGLPAGTGPERAMIGNRSCEVTTAPNDFLWICQEEVVIYEPE
jgi:hypothetical protein